MVTVLHRGKELHNDSFFSVTVHMVLYYKRIIQLAFSVDLKSQQFYTFIPTES